VLFIVDSILTGLVAPLGPEPSAIAKSPVDGARVVGWLGIEGDAQADLSVHGGPDKAIHHYPRDHYGWWQTRFGALPVLEAPGAFGENVSTMGLTEDAACIGDRFRLGTALVEIAQGRQPCWKQAFRLGQADTVSLMVQSGRCGWYYRVIEEGSVATGDALALVDRPHPTWSVARVIALLIAGGARREPDAVRALAQLEVLASGWRQRAAALARR
jgi:MOSC domain-containing protein YiiM